MGGWRGLREVCNAVRSRQVFRRLWRALPVASQCGLAAAAAWWFASAVLGHPQPVFAGTAAVICLAAGLGGRARQATDLLVGVLIGVAVGQLARSVGLDLAPLSLLLMVTVALVGAALVDDRPLAFIQAGASALFLLALPGGVTPVARLVDAAVGGAFGLIGSQLVFTPDPVRLALRPARELLTDVASALDDAARTLEGDGDRAGSARRSAQRASAGLGTLAAARRTARDVTARTVRGRFARARVAELDRRLDGVEELVPAMVLIVGDVTARPAQGGDGELAQQLRELARAVAAASESLLDSGDTAPHRLAVVSAELTRLVRRS